ncbi:hypothetical protein BY996DRAFT_6551002 [Phakopsora pachyrhizi]|nr:hypothetical protein BY996DRAFT_6551002 [Phakopsora pachyrhizi]
MQRDTAHKGRAWTRYPRTTLDSAPAGVFVGFLLGFEEEGVAEKKLGGGAHQGQSGWSKTTGAMDFLSTFFKEAPDLEILFPPEDCARWAPKKAASWLIKVHWVYPPLQEGKEGHICPRRQNPSCQTRTGDETQSLGLGLALLKALGPGERELVLEEEKERVQGEEPEEMELAKEHQQGGGAGSRRGSVTGLGGVDGAGAGEGDGAIGGLLPCCQDEQGRLRAQAEPHLLRPFLGCLEETSSSHRVQHVLQTSWMWDPELRRLVWAGALSVEPSRSETPGQRKRDKTEEERGGGLLTYAFDLLPVALVPRNVVPGQRDDEEVNEGEEQPRRTDLGRLGDWARPGSKYDTRTMQGGLLEDTGNKGEGYGWGRGMAWNGCRYIVMEGGVRWAGRGCGGIFGKRRHGKGGAATVGRSGKCEVCQVRKRPCEFTRKKEISKGPMVWCKPDLKAFGYEHPLVQEPTPAYPSDGSSICEFLTSLVPIYSRDHLLTFDIVAYNGRRSVMRCVWIPTGGVAIGRNAWTNHEGVVVDSPTGSQPKRQIASLPDNPVSEDSVRAHIAKSQGMRQHGQQGARDPKAVDLVSPPPLPGHGTSADTEVPLKKILPPRHQSSVAPSPIPPTPIKKKEFHHPTLLGGFPGTNPYGPQAYIGVLSQASSPKLPGPFAFEYGVPRWTKTAEPLSNPLFQQEKATAQRQISHSHKAYGETMNKVANMMPNKQIRSWAVDEWLKDLELSNYMGLDRKNTKGKGREK